MNIKRLISVSLLTFVFFSIAFLAYKEFSHRVHEKANTITEVQTQNTSPTRKSALIEDKDTVAKKIIPETQKAALPVQPVQQAIKSKVIAYYFHGTHRCPTCLNIERYSREAIEKHFSKELQDKRLEFKPLNIEEPGNRHYIQDYQLFTKSLVITLRKGDKQIKWKTLTDVWTHVSDKEKFYQYVKDEIETFLKEIE